eukprot:CAMPEP_0185591534 /NCGR_PEP_ID=MMETSP0434-20130131/64849_1 /TAXON_ID=626734 ORGANISM="Favella taraikaensis, Strain Fe Narragansett Bay" /NCGR_SAMPLE_ID=MMETSP0434 /ASSEMBLY_ACC=CAM_ASM_000379 /LENGTH=33 /DNA_ID= /DNA_START= /DNA_END= /DNA_ORIENTATION=
MPEMDGPQVARAIRNLIQTGCSGAEQPYIYCCS